MTVIYFKTSHVIVYLQRIRTRHSYPLISKHLMLLFILKDERDELKYMHFKTSYVIVYQQRFLGVQKLILDFKTSYVIVYRLCKCMGVTKQNNFKTSYVIVYLNSANHDSNNTEFQNILCYCLSFSTVGQGLLDLAFQNILCYCLSPYGIRFRNR